MKSLQECTYTYCSDNLNEGKSTVLIEQFESNTLVTHSFHPIISILVIGLICKHCDFPNNLNEFLLKIFNDLFTY